MSMGRCSRCGIELLTLGERKPRCSDRDACNARRVRATIGQRRRFGVLGRIRVRP